MKEMEYDCCRQKIQYFLKLEHGVHISVPKIYQILSEKYVIRSKWKKNKERGHIPKAIMPREVIRMDTIDFGGIFAYTAIDMFIREADILLAPELNAKFGCWFLHQSMRRRFGSHVRLLQTDGGSEFKAEFTRNVSSFCDRHRVARPYRKNEQSYIESFNRTVRKECLGWQNYRPDDLAECTDYIKVHMQSFINHVYWEDGNMLKYVWHMNQVPEPKATEFSDRLVNCNGLNKRGFEGWIFYPGMLFGSFDKWWDEKQYRNNPHEGLDICLYRTKDRNIYHLDERFKIPAIFEGEIIKISDDFIGKSIYVYNSIYNDLGHRLLTAYGHMTPSEDIHTGKIFEGGDILGNIAEIDKRSDGLFPHLHISFGWMLKSLSHKMLNWETMVDTNLVTLLDPLEIITCPYSVILPSGDV